MIRNTIALLIFLLAVTFVMMLFGIQGLKTELGECKDTINYMNKERAENTGSGLWKSDDLKTTVVWWD